MINPEIMDNLLVKLPNLTRLDIDLYLELIHKFHPEGILYLILASFETCPDKEYGQKCVNIMTKTIKAIEKLENENQTKI